MATGMHPAKQPVSALLAGRYGHPYHPMLVTVPIGSWVASLVFDIGSHVVSRPAFLDMGARWLIATGLGGAVLAACAGFLDLAAIPPGTAAFRTACTHMLMNLLLMTAYAGDFAWRYRAHPARGGVDPAMIALSAACLAALGVSGYLGGKLTYRYGVRVAAEAVQAEGFTQPVIRHVTGPRRRAAGTRRRQD